MTNYILRRLLLLPVLLIGTSLLVFLVISFLSPAERSALWLRDIPKNEAAWDSAIKKYCLDCPFYVQYWRWMVGVYDETTGEWVGGVLRGNLGYSRTGKQYVAELIAQRFPATLELAIFAAIPIILGGVWLGVQSAVHHNKAVDQIARLFSIVGWSFPTFVFGLIVLMVFYARLEWFPPGRLSNWALREVMSPAFTQYTGLMTVDSILNGRFDILLDALRHLVLPVITLSYLSWALLLRVTRSSMLETLRQDYITTARSKGLAERQVVNRHALRNALIPVATISGLLVVGLLNGVVITETIFDYPGIGSAAVAAALQLDVITVLGFVLFNGAILIIANLVVDILYGFLDPRVTLG